MNFFAEKKQSLTASFSKQIIPTLQMQQSFHVLQLPILELAEWLHEQILINPALEREENSFDDSEESSSSLERKKEEYQFSKQKTNKELFLEQIEQTFTQDEELLLAKKIFESLDSKGLLHEEDEKRLKEDPRFISVLCLLQRLPPFGIGSKDLRESLLLQLEGLNKKNTLAYRLVHDHYPLLLKGSVLLLAKTAKTSLEKVSSALQKDLKVLRLGAFFEEEAPSQWLHCDLSIFFKDEKWEIEIHSELLPSFTISSKFIEKMNSCKEEAKPYLKDMLSSANFIKTCIEKRNATLRKIALYLIDKHKSFLEGESIKMEPLSIKEAAKELSCHPSTLTRAIQEKTLNCVYGYLPLKSLFSHSLGDEDKKGSSHANALLQLKQLILEEDKEKPLSDTALLLALKEKGIHCARRTITKYRNSLSIPNVAKRRRSH